MDTEWKIGRAKINALFTVQSKHFERNCSAETLC